MTVSMKGFQVPGVPLFFLCVAACNACGLNSVSGDGSFEPIELPETTMAEGVADLCGNGVVETGEECDDGNRVSCDGCSTECRIEVDGCSSQDGDSDGGGEGIVPDALVPITEPLPVEQDPGEDVHDSYWLHLMWTGDYFSFLYTRTCPSDPIGTCLGMRRFGKDGLKIGPDWVYTPTAPAHHDIRNSVEFFDVCWNDPEYGLAWVETECDEAGDLKLTRNAYFQRLNAEGKVMGDPILLAGDITRGCCPLGRVDYPVRIGCSPEGYVVGYIQVFSWGLLDPYVAYTYLHELALDGLTAGGVYFGSEGTNGHLWPESLKHIGGEWRLLHSIELVQVLLEGIDQDLSLTWRAALQTCTSSYTFDMDVDEETGNAAVTYSYEGGTYFAVVDEAGNVETAAGILEDFQQTVTRIAALGSGLYAILWTTPLWVASEPLRVEVVDEIGTESDAVVVFSSLDNPYTYENIMLADVVWTGEEIAVVVLAPDPASAWLLPYLQLLRP